MTDTATADAARAAAMEAEPSLVQGRGVRGYGRLLLSRMRGGDLGSLPVVVGLAVIVVVFQTLNPTFLSSFNLVSLAAQIASTGIIAAGIVLVLMLGEIDLSVGSVSGVAAAVLAVANVGHGMSAALAILLAVACGSVIGLIHGLVFTRIGVPSFVVTLAGLLVWLGVQQRVLGPKGTINLPVGGWLTEVGQFAYLPPALGYLLALVTVAGYVASALRTRARRSVARLTVPPLWLPLGRGAVLAAVLLFMVHALSADRGVPWIFVLFVLVVGVTDWVLHRTRYGRSVFAIGGNIEAARRAGIKVDLVRTSVFVVGSTLAALGGVVGAMRAGSAGLDTGGGDVLINAIAAAVIGGTSLFGGRTRMYSALLGMLVIGSISNGLNLLSLSSDVRYVITGSVLLAAVIIDAASQRTRRHAGRA